MIYLPDVPVLSINRSSIYQFILGFGGAFTDAAGINIKSVTPKLQKVLMDSYFSENGKVKIEVLKSIKL